MTTIAFVDTEIEPISGEILDIGSVKHNDSSFHNGSLSEFAKFIKGTTFVCGHNIIKHDLKYIGKAIDEAGISEAGIIDTLYLSPLLFPTNPYHSLLKDDKLQTDDTNNPLNDSKKARDLLHDEVAAFKQTDEKLKQIFYLLLGDKKEFRSFFRFVAYNCERTDATELIAELFNKEICQNVDLVKIISETPVELAYCLSLIHSFIRYKKIHSITPPWVLKNYPEVERIMFRLRSKPCITGCQYCNNALDGHKGLKKFFGHDVFRSYGGEPLQEKAVKAAIDNKSILAVFPTGGGKSITFQIPALISAETAKSLTIVITPLQSLMKDQVDNLEKRGITEAVTINGLLDPIERAKSYERIENGSASILYLSPESLRSKTIERLLLGRKISRFVIDEAHCLSAWGQDFRVDYLYIGDFIKNIQEKKNLEDAIPVSCFTATAKQKVIEDIREYFKHKLSLDLQLFTSKVSRTNLHYKVFEKENNEEKYLALRALISEKNCTTIIYVSRTQNASKLAQRLSNDGFNAKPFHGKMDAKEKTANQNAFIAGDVQIMVATSAFGMGVDKKDIAMVIHYEISDSLENYVQEAGRAGRDEATTAECYVLYNEEDLSKHFILLNQTKLSIKEIQQIWKAIKRLTRLRATVSNSALEIARQAGWDDAVSEIETRVKTAIAALEDAGYIKRGQNEARVFANSILSKTAQEAKSKIIASTRFSEEQKEKAIRIIKKLFSSKSRKQSNDETAESRVDYISDHLGIVSGEVMGIINILREEKILDDAKDMRAYLKKGEHKNQSLQIVDTFCKIENFLLEHIEEEEKVLHFKKLNEKAEAAGISEINTNRIKTQLNFWAIKNWVKRYHHDSRNLVSVVALDFIQRLKEKAERRHSLAKFIVDFLYQRSDTSATETEELVEFSVHELKAAYENSTDLFKEIVSIEDVEDTLFYLSRIESIKIEGGFMVIYNRLKIERIENNNKKQYTKDDYQKLQQFYESKIQQVHIVGEYARRMIEDYKNALQFVEDYFQLNYSSFLDKYFKGSRQNEIKRNITPSKFKQLFGELSPTQLKIINDNETKHIVVAAGPGSGKTRVLVHKLASLLLMEDVKHEQLLMLTFSRAAATEFKKRLLKLIGNAAHYIEIKTFHSYCFDLLGKVGSLEKSAEILKKTIEKIRNNEVEANRVTKTVLVIDEAQDMNAEEFELVKTLMDQNEEMRVIAVGDDDQNIYEFRGADSKYFEDLMKRENAVKHELVENYRSKNNLVEYSNQFAAKITERLKQTPIFAHQKVNGKIKIIRYWSGNLIHPLVKDILSTGLAGTTCVLTKTNDEALRIAGLLLKNNVQAKLIQSNEGFSLYNLNEVRFFLNQLNLSDDVFTINDDAWQYAKRETFNKFRHSTRFDILVSLIKDFDAVNTKTRYKSDLEAFIRESRLEDLFSTDGETIFVSTIHKAKGKEFDNVFLMLEDQKVNTDKEKRQIYVAMTRAKQNLTIHLNSSFLDDCTRDYLDWIEDKEYYSEPDELAMHLTFTGVWLDYFINKQHLITELKSGDLLTANGDECLNSNGQSVLKFSKQMQIEIADLNAKGYALKSAKVNFIVFWKSEKSNEEVKVILPEILFQRIT